MTLSAAQWNAIVDAAAAEKARRHSVTSETSPHPEQRTIVRLKNATGGNLPRHAIVDIQGGPIFTPGQSLETFLSDVTFRGTVPTAQTKHSFAVLLDPIPTGAIGRATVGGTTWCKVNMVDASHVSAEAVAGNTTALQSVKWSGNPHNILWTEAGTGTRWSLLRMDAGGCGCATEEPPPTGCCPIEVMPATLYLSDGFGTVPLLYNGPETTPTTSANSWWGCAMRPGSLVRNFNNPPFSDCTTPGTNADVAVHFQLFCDTFTPTGYRLSLHLPSCTDTQTGRRYLANHPTYNCSAPSSPTVYGITSAGTNAPPVLPEDCADFAISIPAVFLAPGPTQDAQLPYYIYGTSETFLITE